MCGSTRRSVSALQLGLTKVIQAACLGLAGPDARSELPVPKTRLFPPCAAYLHPHTRAGAEWECLYCHKIMKGHDKSRATKHLAGSDYTSVGSIAQGCDQVGAIVFHNNSSKVDTRLIFCCC